MRTQRALSISEDFVEDVYNSVRNVNVQDDSLDHTDADPINPVDFDLLNLINEGNGDEHDYDDDAEMFDGTNQVKSDDDAIILALDAMIASENPSLPRVTGMVFMCKATHSSMF